MINRWHSCRESEMLCKMASTGTRLDRAFFGLMIKINCIEQFPFKFISFENDLGQANTMPRKKQAWRSLSKRVKSHWGTTKPFWNSSNARLADLVVHWWLDAHKPFYFVGPRPIYANHVWLLCCHIRPSWLHWSSFKFCFGPIFAWKGQGAIKLNIYGMCTWAVAKGAINSSLINFYQYHWSAI